MRERKMFKLYDDIIMTKGFTRTILLDTTREKHYFIPNDLYEILINDVVDFEYLISNDSSENAKILLDFQLFLLKNDLIFEVAEEDYDLFNKTEKKWFSPYIISNIVIDIDEESNISYITNVEEDFNKLGIEALQIRLFAPRRLLEIKGWIVSLNNSLNNKLNDIQLEICNIDKKSYIFIKKSLVKIEALPIITSINIYHKNDYNYNGKTDKIDFINKIIVDEKSCGEIANNINFINKKIINESANFNSCLNCKVSIDSRGNVRNCPSLDANYGKIDKVSLEEIVNRDEFQNLWKISKDDIEICKDCEFRYICTDCRAYLKDPHNIYSKPLKCGYNPYTGEMSDWKKSNFEAMAYYEFNIPSNLS